MALKEEYMKKLVLRYMKKLGLYVEIIRLEHFLNSVKFVVNFIREGELCCL
jgi:hypothetical protein